MCFTRRKTKQEIHNPRTCVIEIHTEQDSGGYGVGGVGCCGGGGGGGGNFSDGDFGNIRRGGKNQNRGVGADDSEKNITTGRNIQDHRAATVAAAAKSGGSRRQNDCVPPDDNDITSGGGGDDIQGGGGRREIDQKANAKGGGNYNNYVGEKTEGGADHVSHTKPTTFADIEPPAAAFINESPRYSVKAYRYARPPSAINFAPAAPVVNFYVHSISEGMNRGCTIM